MVTVPAGSGPNVGLLWWVVPPSRLYVTLPCAPVAVAVMVSPPVTASVRARSQLGSTTGGVQPQTAAWASTSLVTVSPAA